MKIICDTIIEFMIPLFYFQMKLTSSKLQKGKDHLIPEFLKWTFSSLNMNTAFLQLGIRFKNNNRAANSADSDGMAYEPSHLDLHCLQ